TDVRDVITQRMVERGSQQVPSADLNKHQIEQIAVTGQSATVMDCFIDGRVAIHGDGSRNDDIVTKALTANLKLLDGTWRITIVDWASPRRADG
ncbi:MAG: hypothetical protein ABIV94_11025, partial [Acidimicrobiales bacterium]